MNKSTRTFIYGLILWIIGAVCISRNNFDLEFSSDNGIKFLLCCVGFYVIFLGLKKIDATTK